MIFSLPSRFSAVRLAQPVLCSLLVAAAGSVHAQSMIPLWSNGAASERINIVILSEGYQAGELAQFRTDATNTLAALFANSPLTGYEKRFNAYAISVASVDSGSDHPSRGVYKNTYFNTSYDVSGIARYLTVLDRTPVYNTLFAFVPNYDLVVILVNDTEYGGSGGRFMTISKHASSAEIARHELGHAFANLGDEYTTGESTGTELSNATQVTDRNLTPWKSWIAGATPLPTPDSPTTATNVGLFAGAHYSAAGWYRPKSNCKMRSLGVDFCEVCREALVKAIYSRGGPIRTQFPSSVQAAIVAASSRSFSVGTVTPTNQPLEVKWVLNGTQLGTTGTNLVLNASQLLPGNNTLTVNVADKTSFVRSDPGNSLKASYSWQVTLDNGPQLKLDRPVALPDGRVVFSLQGNAPNGFRIERSTNFTTWTTVATYGPTNGTINYTNPATPGTVRTFRAVILP